VPLINCFSRNRCTNVEQIDDTTMRSTCRLQDTLMDAFVEIKVRLPDLEIISVEGEIKRTHQKSCLETTDFLERVIGVRIGPGMQKIFEGLLGGATDCRQFVFMLEECCHGIILTFTKENVLKWPEDQEALLKYLSNDVKKHIRLYNRCAAFAPPSAIVDGIEPPG
jgi:hypothetical protein